MVVFGQKWLLSGKSVGILAKMVVFGQSCCIQQKWLYLGKVVVFGQKLYLGKVVVFGQKCLYFFKVVLFGQSGFVLEKVVVVGQKRL